MSRVGFIAAAVVALFSQSTQAFTVGSPGGMAAGATGGGNVSAVYPTTNAELVSYLKSKEPQVIVLNKTFDFRGTEGTVTEPGCRPDYTRKCMALNNGFKSQDVILQGGALNNTGGCTNGTSVTVTYDKAALTFLTVTGNKTIRGVGTRGVLMSKGLWLNGDNIIVQNIHITELNRHLVWGGDAFYMQGTNGGSVPMQHIWLDHIKISHIGRQFLTTNAAGVASMTISNSDLDGNTDYSKTCDGHHYWSFIFYGKHDGVSMVNNYIHSLSGRLPRAGSPDSVIVHIANNYYEDNSYHSMEIATGSYVLAEGNYFKHTTKPLYDGDDPDIGNSDYGSIYTESGENLCSQYLGRSCVANVLESSGRFASMNGTKALEAVKLYPVINGYATQPPQLLTVASNNFGVGTLE